MVAGGWDGPYFKNLVAGAQWPVVSRQPRGQQLRSVDPPSTIVQPNIVKTFIFPSAVRTKFYNK